MKNIGILDVISVIILVLLLYIVFRQINRKKYLGKLIFKESRNFSSIVSIFYWSLLSCFSIVFFIDKYSNIDQSNHIISSLISPFVFTLTCFSSLLEIKYDKEIREKGITIIGGYIYWKDIINYKWLSHKKLQITFKTFVFKKLTREWTVESEDKEKVDMLLSRYTNIEV